MRGAGIRTIPTTRLIRRRNREGRVSSERFVIDERLVLAGQHHIPGDAFEAHRLQPTARAISVAPSPSFLKATILAWSKVTAAGGTSFEPTTSQIGGWRRCTACPKTCRLSRGRLTLRLSRPPKNFSTSVPRPRSRTAANWRNLPPGHDRRAGRCRRKMAFPPRLRSVRCLAQSTLGMHRWGLALSSFTQGGARGGAAGLAMAVRADQQIGVVILSLLAPGCANR
jgi:hypothetical protein